MKTTNPPLNQHFTCTQRFQNVPSQNRSEADKVLLDRTNTGKAQEKQQESGEPPGTKQKKIETKRNEIIVQNFKYVSARDVFIC